ncbi:MAG: LamG-like jellyroll fold domain-containing protein [Opitutaceae bacterium]
MARTGLTGGIGRERHRRGLLAKRQPLGHGLLDRLVEWWPLTEQSGVRLGVHGGINLADINTVTGADGVGSLASQFTAANTEQLSIASLAALQMGDVDFTIVAWAYPTSSSGTKVIVSKDNNTAGTRDYELAPFNTDLEFNVFRATDTARQAILAGVMTANAWQMCAGWHNAAADTVNVERNASGTIASTATGGALQAASASEFQIGARQFVSSRAAWDGRIQRVGIWRRVLTADERTWLYNGGRGRDYPFV